MDDKKRSVWHKNDMSLRDEYVIGIDMGGTNTLFAASSLEGSIVVKCNQLTPKLGGVSLSSCLTSMVEGFMEHTSLSKENLRAIGLGVPGAVDIEHGSIFLAPNLGLMDRYPIRGRLEEYFGVPVWLDNDVNMAALGEQAYGIAQGISDFIFVAVGTGIGAAMVLDNQLYRGSHYCAGEIGYMTFSESFPKPTNDNRGYLELVSSGKGIAERAANQLMGNNGSQHATDTKKVFENAVAGNKVAKNVISQAVSALSLAIANMIVLLDPKLVVLGGGVLTKTELINELKLDVERLVPHKSRIELSILGEEAQVYGAVASALNISED